MKFVPSATVTQITLKVGRVGYAIGKKGKTIKKLTTDVSNILNNKNIKIEVEQLQEPELNPDIMAIRLAAGLERGRHFRRTAYGTVRRIMQKGALGVEIIVSGKITSQRARVEKFKEGFIAKTGDPKRRFVRIGNATAKIKRGTLGISVLIMMPDSVLPDHIEITAEPTHTSGEIKMAEDQEKEDYTMMDLEETAEADLEELDQFEDLTEEEIPKEAMQIHDEDEELDLEEEEEIGN
jgi:small subunit ribosomal protein S3